MTILEMLTKMFREGKITRREFLAKASALGVAAAVSPALFGSKANAATPKKGGRLRIGMQGGSTSDTMDPAKFNDIYQQMTSMGFLRNPLVEIDNQGNAIPDLAESFEAKPDAKSWVFNLRKGAEFHNGKSVDADDVIFSIKRHQDEKLASQIRPLVKPIKEIKKDGPTRVIFELEGANADFPYILAETRTPIVPAGTTNFEDVIGTGGYQLTSYEAGVRTLAKRFPNYYKENRAHFDEIEVIIMPDANARTVALKTGQVDVINRPDRKTAHLLGRAPNLQLVNVPGGLLYTFPMLCDTPPYDNVDARLALKHSVDRKALLKAILRGYGVLGNDHPIAPIVKFSAADLPQRTYDPDKARFHLKKAGLEGHTFKLHTSDAAFAGAVDASILWQGHAKKAGINIEVVREPVDGYWDNVWNKKGFSSCFWFARVTADWMFTMAYAADAPANDMHWKHERFNKLLVEARGELDEKKRKEMYHEMQQIVRDEGGVVIPMIANMVDAASKKVKFNQPAGNQELDGLRICERWWFAS
ncbi:MAG: ABC transporter substrate-binding protein [Desulfobacterales bacterium]